MKSRTMTWDFVQGIEKEKFAECGEEHDPMIQRPKMASIAPFLFLLLASMSLAPQTFAQDDLAELRKKLRKAEKDQRDVTKKIEDLKSKLLTKKKRLEKKHKAAFDFSTQKEVGAKLATWFNENPETSTPEAAIAGTKDILVKAYGTEIFNAAKPYLFDQFAQVIDDMQKSKKPVEPTTLARGLKDTFEGAPGKDYDQAFDKFLKTQTRDWTKLEKAQKKQKSLELEIDGLRLRQTASIDARIPQGMIPVPAAKDIKLGLTCDQLQEITHDLGDELGRNSLLLWSTPPIQVSVDEFMIDKFEVTHQAYWYFCTQTDYKRPQYIAKFEDQAGLDENGKKKKMKAIWKDCWPDDKIPENVKDLPMTWVSYNDAVAYCKWTQSRLPTEFEWELSARSGKNGFDQRIWPFGRYRKEKCNDATAINTQSRRDMDGKLPKDNYIPAVVPVGEFSEGSTPLGIFDLAGSVAEFTSSPFVPYPGYTGKIKTKQGTIEAENMFNADHIVYRGGHCDNRDVVVSSVFRFPMDSASRRKKLIGFRRARSGESGKDQLANLMLNNRLDSRLTDFKLVKDEIKNKWIFPHLDTRKGYYDIAEKFDWNEELNVPGKGHKILIANRLMTCLTNYKWAKSFSKGDNDVADSLLIGMFHTDVDIMEPPLKAGTWFVSFKRSRKFVDPDSKRKKKKTLPDAIMYVPFKSGEPAVRVPYKGSEIIAMSKKEASSFKTQITPVVIGGEGSTYDKLIATWVFDNGRSGKKTIVEIPFKVAPGSLKGFK